MRSLLWVKPKGQAETTTQSTIAQLIPTLIVNLAALSSGLSLGFSAIALPQLRPFANASADSPLYQPFTVDEESGSWVASIFGLGAIFGGLASAFLGSRFGRRKSILAMAIPDLVGWILIASSQNLSMILTGRFLSGFSAAGYSPSIQVFIAEIAQPQHRGWLCSLTMPIMALGTLISYSLGAAMSWHYVAVVGGCFPVVLMVALTFISDSPYWYMQQGDDKKACQVMEKFRSAEANALSELLAISETLRTDCNELGWRESIRLLTQRQHRRPFLILNFLFVLMFFSGNVTLSFYAVDIFRMSTRGLNEYKSAIILGVIKLVGTILFVPAIRYFSRKLLLCCSSLIMGLSLLVLAVVMYSRETGGTMGEKFEGLYWLPLLCITLFMIADSIGLGSIPFVYVGEFFASEMRSVMSGLTTALANIELFLAVKTFPNLCTRMGDSGAFWLYAAVCFAAIIYTLICIPETRGKSLQDIEKYFGFKESLHVTPFPTPKETPHPSPTYPRLSLQFTL